MKLYPKKSQRVIHASVVNSTKTTFNFSCFFSPQQTLMKISRILTVLFVPASVDSELFVFVCYYYYYYIMALYCYIYSQLLLNPIQSSSNDVCFYFSRTATPNMSVKMTDSRTRNYKAAFLGFFSQCSCHESVSPKRKLDFHLSRIFTNAFRPSLKTFSPTKSVHTWYVASQDPSTNTRWSK